MKSVSLVMQSISSLSKMTEETASLNGSTEIRPEIDQFKDGILAQEWLKSDKETQKVYLYLKSTAQKTKFTYLSLIHI